MIGAGTFLNPLIKIVTTVAILAAVYVFAIRPVLDTTEELSGKAFEQSEQIRDGVQESISQSLRESRRTARQNGVQTFEVSKSSQGSLKDANRLLGCVQRAQGDVAKIQACSD